MYYYTVNKVGDGTEYNPFRPDYDGIYIWSDRECQTCNTYLIALPIDAEETLSLKKVTDLESACISRDLNYKDVMKWK